MKKQFFLGILTTLILASCGTKQPQVRLIAVTDNIIRVSSTMEKDFSDNSLMVCANVAQSVGTTTVHGDTTILETNCLRAYECAGRVWITDLAGNVLLSEHQREFQPYQCRQTDARGKEHLYKGWTIRQTFDNLFPEEGLYGLGQHQGDDWNWKGRNEQLYQYNTKVSLPFVISSMGYGILFDSNSLCRFGNPRAYSQLAELFDLTDKDGVAGALTGTYTLPGAEPVVRREDSLYFDDIFTIKNLPADCPLQKAKVVYEGTITPRVSGEYELNHYYSGYQRLYIDGQPLSRQIWRTAWNPNARRYRIAMEAGRAYAIRLEWTPDGGEAYCSLTGYLPVDNDEQQRLSFWSEMTQQQDYYFIYGADTDGDALTTTEDAVIAGYRHLTGKAPIMPLWVHGYWQSRERYKTQDEILDALDGFRQRHLPIDNIVMDWNYWVDDQWGAFRFDPERFADPQAMIDRIHEQHAHIMISCWPKYYLGTDNFKELNEKGYIYQQSIRDSLYDWLGYHYAFYDAYHPEAQNIFWRQLWENLGVLGMDSWWMDASEPNIRDCTPIEYRKLLCGPTYLGSSDEYFNAYSLPNAMAIYDGQRETKVNADGSVDRVFLLTRNGFPGLQRYSTATWSGDIGTRWEDMRAQITAGLNFSISGVPYWGQDIGGFSVENRFVAAQNHFNSTGIENDDLKEWRELNVRWHEWGMFSPLYRAHGQFPFREPWAIAPEGHPAYSAIVSCMNLRYRLMPYIYSMAGAVHFRDYTIMRPLVMDFTYDPAVRDLGYQYMFGPAIMVCPVYEYGQREREVYFPVLKAGQWYDFYTGLAVSHGGESLVASAPYDRIPLYVRSGSIIPMGPTMEYTGQRAEDPIVLCVYPGADGTFTLYEDEGTNYGYEQGAYSTITFTWDDAAKTLTVGDRIGSFPGMLQSRTFLIRIGAEKKLHKLSYSGQAISLSIDR